MKGKKQLNPNLRYWVCECGASGWMIAKNTSLAGCVRQARSEHRCPDPDIVRIETLAEYDRKILDSHIHAGVY